MPTPLPSSSLALNHQLARLTAFLLPLLSVNQVQYWCSIGAVFAQSSQSIVNSAENITAKLG
jgi:hypothetical protein